MQRTYKVYKHISPNGKIYIGQTCQTTSKRFRHDGTGYARCPYFYAAIQKYGWDSFEHQVICDNLTKEEADWIEKYMIRYYQADNKSYGYNLTIGGEGSAGVVRSEEFKKHLSEINKGKKLSEEHRRKIAEGNRGKKLSDKQRRILSEVNKGKKLSQEHIEKLRNIARIRVRTREEIEKSASKHRGKPLSEETRKKISISHLGQLSWNAKKVLCIETGKIYESARKAGFDMGLNSNNISSCCNGKRNRVGNYTFKYIEHPQPEE